ncbi:hypothetical protein BFW01_g1687 [Lasiodiplodia theobromae]|nr:hypothetical protein BFW01_g1687 [Lasiodiplodia theobromae]
MARELDDIHIVLGKKHYRSSVSTLSQSRWNSTVEQLIDSFGESPLRSIRFLENLSNLSKEDVQWSVARDAIIHARQNRSNGSNEALPYAPKDVERAAQSLGHPIKTRCNRKRDADVAPAPPPKRHCPGEKHSDVPSVLRGFGFDPDRIPALAAFLEAPLVKDSSAVEPTLDTERPQVSPWQHWNREHTFTDVCKSILADVMDPGKGQVWCADQELKPSDADIQQEKSSIMTSIMMPDTSADSCPRSYIMNAPAQRLESDRALPQTLGKRTMLEVQEASANVTPRGIFVDLHHDTTYGMETLWGGPKLWLFYPPSPSNLTALAAASGQRNRLQSCCCHHDAAAAQRRRRLSGGFAILQRAGETLLLPPYWPHATFALGDSILAGHEVSFAEELPKELRHVGLDVTRAAAEAGSERDARAQVKKHVEGLVKRVEKALANCGEKSTRYAIYRAWVAQKEALVPLLDKHDKANKAAKAWMEALKAEGREAVRLVECPFCDEEDLDLVAHIDAAHVKGKRRRQQ